MQLIKDLQYYLKSIFVKGSFLQNLSFVTGSKVVVILIGILFTPILTRVYDPDAYGYFAEFNAYLGILSTVVTLSLTTAFVLPKKEVVFLGLLRVVLICTLVTAVLFGLFVLINGRYQIVDMRGFGLFIWLVVPAVFLSGFNQSLTGWSIRLKKFRSTSVLSSVIGLSSKSFSLGFGLLTAGYQGGIIFAHLFGQLISFFGMLFIVGKSQLRKLFKKVSITKSLNEYKDYPLFVFPAQWIANLTNHLPVIFLAPVFGAGLMGQYALCNSILYLPVQLIGQNAIGPVLIQKTTELQNNSNTQLAKKIELMYLVLSVISVILFSITFHFAEPLFGFVFGTEWREAGSIASAMSIFFATLLISAPTSSIMRVLRKEKANIILAGAYLTVSGIAIYIAIYLEQFMAAIWVISLGHSVIRVFYVWIFGNMIQLRWKNILVVIIGGTLTFNLILFGLISLFK